MCGIVGIVDPQNRFSKVKLEEASNLIKLRGPDAQGIFVDQGIGFAHQRLSIIDLSNDAKQPMHSSCGRYTIVFNGEIYNFAEIKKEINLKFPEFQWKSLSDTEVLLEGYRRFGTDIISKIRGMFAFAIWDHQEKKLTMARDRVGQKPFYYYHNDQQFIFSSRPKPIISLNPNAKDEIDRQALRYYLEIGYFPKELSIYKKIRKLPAGHFAIFQNGKLEIKRYWNFSSIEIDPSLNHISETKLLTTLEEKLSASIQEQMISDVPLGAFLSGGIDSTLIVALAQKIGQRAIKTFTIGFLEKDWDESHDASRIATYLKTDHQVEHLEVDALLELQETFFNQFDEPFFDNSAFPTMAVSRLARRYVTVALSGDGGDEFFGGYPYYHIVSTINKISSFLGPITPFLADLLNIIPRHKIKLLSTALKKKNPAEVFAFARSISKDFSQALEGDYFKETQSLGQLFKQREVEFSDKISIAEKAMRLDTSFTLPDDYLQKVDIASMAFSLEVRSPFLDHRLIEWALTLPTKWKIRNNVNKYLLRQLCYQHVPQKIMDRPKRGFGVPVGHWLKGPLKNWATDYFNKSEQISSLGINPEYLNQLWNLHLSGKRDVHPFLWAVVMLLEFNNTQEKPFIGY